MKITQSREGTHLTLSLEGRLDTTTAPHLESEMKEILPDTEKLTLDLKRLEYVSSAGLRVILFAQKQMNKKNGEMIVMNANASIMEVLEITGFTDILTIV